MSENVININDLRFYLEKIQERTTYGECSMTIYTIIHICIKKQHAKYSVALSLVLRMRTVCQLTSCLREGLLLVSR